MMAKIGIENTLAATLSALYGVEKMLVESFALTVEICGSINLVEALQIYCMEAEDRCTRLAKVAANFNLVLRDEAPEFVDKIVEEFGDYSLESEQSADLDALILFGTQRVVYFQLAAYRRLCAIIRGRNNRATLELVEDSLAEIVYAEEMFSAILDNEVNPIEFNDEPAATAPREPARLSLVSSR